MMHEAATRGHYECNKMISLCSDLTFVTLYSVFGLYRSIDIFLSLGETSNFEVMPISEFWMESNGIIRSIRSKSAVQQFSK